MRLKNSNQVYLRLNLESVIINMSPFDKHRLSFVNSFASACGHLDESGYKAGLFEQ